MNGFRTFKKYKNGEVNFKIWIDDKADLPTLCLTLSYRGTAEFPGEIRIGIPHKNFSINRDKWMEEKGYDDVALVTKDFEEAVGEFREEIESSKIKNPASVHLLTEANALLEGLSENL